MKADLVIRGGTVIDGTGAPARAADVAVVGTRIVSIGSFDGSASAVIDARGKVVCPGFIDIHTHYDAQLLWDPSASPSPLHGVTTVLGGNCGFSIAPLRADHVDYVMRMMARVEGMSLETLRHGPPWDWTSFAEWLNRLDGCSAVNAGFLAGHSTIRRVVMGDGCHDAAGPEHIDAMVDLLEESLAGGALGFSSSLGEAHTDGDDRPVPSRSARSEEFLALASALRRFGGTTLEFIPAMGEIPDERIRLMTDMSLAAGRSLNWNLLGSLSPTQVFEQQLSSCDHARDRGAHVVALALPDLLTMRSEVLLGLQPWAEVLVLPEADRRRAATDPTVRQRLAASAVTLPEAIRSWDLLVLGDGPMAGRSIASLAAERQMSPEEALIDAVVPGAVPVSGRFPSLAPDLAASPEGWGIRSRVWRDDRVVLGGSDAGAHCDLMCHANYPTVVLGEMTRERGIFDIEDAVRRMTDVPARLYGLRSRGRLREGYFADLVIFDADTVGSRPVTPRFDQPSGGMRLYADADGIDTVVVNGRPIVRAGRFTGDLPGTILRAGRDTDTASFTGGGRQESATTGP